jgi:type IV secretion system protein VirB10
MTELDDPVRLVKTGNPLAQRPVLAAGVLCGVLLVVAIAQGREGAREAAEEETDEVSDVALAPADKAAEEAIRGLQHRERALYEQPLSGPELSESHDFPVDRYLSPRSDVDPSRAEEALRQALTASSKIDVQRRERVGDLPVAGEPSFGEASSHLGGGLRSAELEALRELAGGRDQPKYAQKANFIRHGAEDWPGGYLKGTRQAPLTRYELKAGAVIPAVMISGINSDLPGQILAQVAEDVYDTATGRFLVIPQGSKLVGTYDNEVAFAQRRALVIWTKIIYPDASQLELEGMPGANPSGYAGFRDKVNRHVARRIGAALLLTLFSLGAELTRQAGQTARGFQTQSAVTAAVGQSVAELGREMVEKESEVPNTLQIRPGYRFHVMVNKDIAFRSPYRRR